MTTNTSTSARYESPHSMSPKELQQSFTKLHGPKPPSWLGYLWRSNNKPEYSHQDAINLLQKDVTSLVRQIQHKQTTPDQQALIATIARCGHILKSMTS